MKRKSHDKKNFRSKHIRYEKELEDRDKTEKEAETEESKSIQKKVLKIKILKMLLKFLMKNLNVVLKMMKVKLIVKKGVLFGCTLIKLHIMV